MTTPPTLSLWPLRYFVVLWMTRSAPSSIGRWRYGLAKVLSTTSRRRADARDRPRRRRSVSRITGLLGVSTNSMRVAGVNARSTRVEIRGVDVGEASAGSALSTWSNSRNVPP